MTVPSRCSSLLAEAACCARLCAGEANGEVPIFGMVATRCCGAGLTPRLRGCPALVRFGAGLTPRECERAWLSRSSWRLALAAVAWKRRLGDRLCEVLAAILVFKLLSLPVRASPAAGSSACEKSADTPGRKPRARSTSASRASRRRCASALLSWHARTFLHQPWSLRAARSFALNIVSLALVVREPLAVDGREVNEPEEVEGRAVEEDGPGGDAEVLPAGGGEGDAAIAATGGDGDFCCPSVSKESLGMTGRGF